MPVRRGLVAPRTTLIETIIRKFDTDSEYDGDNYDEVEAMTSVQSLNVCISNQRGV